MVLYAYALAPSLALVHHIISSMCSHPELPSSFQTRLSISAVANRKQISSATNLSCLALLAIFGLSSGFAVLVQSVVEFAALDSIAQAAAIAEGSQSVAAATGLKDSLASNTSGLQALLLITQGIIIGWMFGVAAQEVRVVAAIEHGLHPIMVQVDVEQGDSHTALSYDESDEDEDK